MANPDRSGSRTFRSGNIYAVVTAGSSGRQSYRIRLFSRRGDGPIRQVKDDGERGASSAHDAAFAAMRDHAGTHPNEFVFEQDVAGWPDFSRPLLREVTDYSRTVALDGLGSITSPVPWRPGSLDGVEGHRIATFYVRTPGGRHRYGVTAMRTRVDDHTHGLSKVTFAGERLDMRQAGVNPGVVLATVVAILQTWMREEKAQYIGFTPIPAKARDPGARARIYEGIMRRVAPHAKRSHSLGPLTGTNDTHVYLLEAP